MGFFDKLKQGMGKTKSSFDEKINNVFKSFRKVDEDFLDELEEILIMSDIGMDTSVKIINNLRNRIKKEKLQDEEDVKNQLGWSDKYYAIRYKYVLNFVDSQSVDYLIDKDDFLINKK